MNYEELWNYFRDVTLKDFADFLEKSYFNKTIDRWGFEEKGIRWVIEQMEHPEAILPYLTEEDEE